MDGRHSAPPDSPRRPRTRGESARLPVQIAIGLLIFFFGLLLLWLLWPLIGG